MDSNRRFNFWRIRPGVVLPQDRELATVNVAKQRAGRTCEMKVMSFSGWDFVGEWVEEEGFGLLRFGLQWWDRSSNNESNELPPLHRVCSSRRERICGVWRDDRTCPPNFPFNDDTNDHDRHPSRRIHEIQERRDVNGLTGYGQTSSGWA